jgi:hypothetical protein
MRKHERHRSWHLFRFYEGREHIFRYGLYGYVVLSVDNVGIILELPEPHECRERAHLMVTVTVGHKIECSIGFLDAAGNPMLVTPTPDAPPTWTNTTPATETLVAAPDGLTAVATAIAAGSDEIDLALSVGGVAFKALVSVTVQAAAQVLTSVVINTKVT